MKHLKKFFEYYVINPNLDKFENTVKEFASEKIKSNKDISFSELKQMIIDSLGGEHEFKYGDDFQNKLLIIDRITSFFIKGGKLD